MIRETIISFLFVFFLVIPAAYTIYIDSRNFRGPAFSDPSQLQEMTEAWKKLHIKYDTEVGEADIVVTLDQHLYSALLPLIRQFGDREKLKISVNEGTCGISSGMLAAKSVDIGGFCCAPGKTDRLPGLRFHTVGIEAISVIVNPDNPVNDITIEQARKIFMGDVLRWSEVTDLTGKKGLDIPVNPVGRLHCKLRPGHWRLLLDKEDFFSPFLHEVGAISDMIAQVALNPGAIGYEVLWNMERYKDKGRVKLLTLNSLSPLDSKGLASGKYPLYRVYNLTTWEGEHLSNPSAMKLVQYLIRSAKSLTKDHHIIPVSVLKKMGWQFRGDELIGEPE